MHRPLHTLIRVIYGVVKSVQKRAYRFAEPIAISGITIFSAVLRGLNFVCAGFLCRQPEMQPPKRRKARPDFEARRVG
jgi:hypothetical protein